MISEDILDFLPDRFLGNWSHLGGDLFFTIVFRVLDDRLGTVSFAWVLRIIEVSYVILFEKYRRFLNYQAMARSILRLPTSSRRTENVNRRPESAINWQSPPNLFVS